MPPAQLTRWVPPQLLSCVVAPCFSSLVCFTTSVSRLPKLRRVTLVCTKFSAFNATSRRLTTHKKPLRKSSRHLSHAEIRGIYGPLCFYYMNTLRNAAATQNALMSFAERWSARGRFCQPRAGLCHVSGLKLSKAPPRQPQPRYFQHRGVGKGGSAVPAPFPPVQPLSILSPHPSGPRGTHKCFGKRGGLRVQSYNRCLTDPIYGSCPYPAFFLLPLLTSALSGARGKHPKRQQNESAFFRIARADLSCQCHLSDGPRDSSRR